MLVTRTDLAICKLAPLVGNGVYRSYCGRPADEPASVGVGPYLHAMGQTKEEIRADMRAAIERDRHLFKDVVISEHLKNAMRRAAQARAEQTGPTS